MLQCESFAAAAGAPCMEGRGTTGMKGRGKREGVARGEPHLVRGVPCMEESGEAGIEGCWKQGSVRG